MSGKINRLFALLTALALLLSGCSLLPDALVSDLNDVTAALPAAETSGEAPVGDVYASDLRRVTIYYPSADNAVLTPVTRLFWLSGDAAAEERVAEEMANTPVGADIVSPIPENMRLAGMESSMGVLTLNLTGESETQDEARTVAMAAALAATFAEMEEIDHVNVLINGRALALCGLPAGSLASLNEQPGRYRQRLEEEAARLSAEAERPERCMTVYCPAAEGGLVAPEVRTVQLESADGVKEALSQLMRAPAQAGLVNGVPAVEKVLEKEPEVREENGLRLLYLDYTMDTFRALEEGPQDRWQFLAAQVLTFTTFCPGLDGVKLSFAGRLVTDAPTGDGAMHSFPDGIMRRRDFTSRLGSVTRLYFADREGRLCAEDRVLAAGDSASPRALIAALMAGPETEGLCAVLPAGLTGADILGVGSAGNVMEINLSADFYRQCQILDADEEALCVYALVNTLAENGFARAVRFYVDGQTVETLAGTISLRGALMPRTGIAGQE